MIDMIEMVRSGSKNEIEGELTSGYTPRNNYTGSFIPYLEEFPQVPIKKPGKSRTAFVLFKTHQIAKEVKGKVKK